MGRNRGVYRRPQSLLPRVGGAGATGITRKRRKGQPPLGGPQAAPIELEAGQHLKGAGVPVPVQSGRPARLVELQQRAGGNGRDLPPAWNGAALEAPAAAPTATTSPPAAPRRARPERELALTTLAAGAVALACALRVLLGGGPAWRPLVAGLLLPVVVVTATLALPVLERRPDGPGEPPPARRALRRGLWAALAATVGLAALVVAG